MSDQSEGAGWWIASDGKWYPPALHPSVRDDAPTRTAAPDGSDTAGSTSAGPERRQGERRKAESGDAPEPTPAGPERRWQGDRRKAEGTEPVGPQFPDLFQKALEGSHLADTISVRYDDDPNANGRRSSVRKAGTAATGAAGGGSGSVTKRRWRKGG